MYCAAESFDNRTPVVSFNIDGMDLDASPAIRSGVADLRLGAGRAQMAARFHNGLAAAMVVLARRARTATGLGTVALSGGVWQNAVLLRLVMRGLEQSGFDVLIHRRVPANDGGLALGQAVLGALLSAG